MTKEELKIGNGFNKSKYEQIAEILNRQGYILDDQAAKIFGNDCIYKVLEHERIWKKFNQDKEWFKDKKIIEKKKGYRCHLVRTIDMRKDSYIKVGKEFYNSIVLTDENFKI